MLGKTYSQSRGRQARLLSDNRQTAIEPKSG
uniref:Uncharacterized protein n=1 Tax=Arundo donax TaxID=35708 RepID=A0A0A9AT73_ARUDO